MRARACALFAVFALAFCVQTALSAATAVSPVQKVIQLIDEFAAKVSKNLDAQSKEFEESAQFCDDEATAKTYAIKDSAEEIEALSATIEDQKAKITQHESNVDTASSQVSAGEGELHAATTMREGEHQDFVKTEKNLLETVDQLDGATQTLKSSLSLAQMNPSQKAALNKIVAGFSQIVEASFVTHAQKEKVQAFLQAREDSQDEISLSSKTAGGGDTIIETLEQMTGKAEGTLADTRKSEMQGSHAFSMLKQGMENSIKSFNEELQANTHGKAVCAETLAQADRSLSVAKKANAEDTAYLADLKRECQTKARDWEAEHRDGNAELEALGKAKGILTQKFGGAFIAAAAKTSRAPGGDGEDSKARALRSIEKLGRRVHSSALVSLAYRASASPFGKIQVMIEDMIAKIQQEAAEAATQKAFCDEEMGKTTKQKEIKEQKLATSEARIERAQAAIASLSEQIGSLSKEIADIDTAVKEAEHLRSKEHSTFVVAEKDLSESQDACASAIEVLREYYAGGSLAQISRQSTSSGLKGNDGSGILAVLEVAESDFAKLLADVRTTEDAAVSDHRKMLQENKLSRATKETESKGKESEVKTLKSSLADSNSDKDSLSDELNAVNQYMAELKPQCESKAPSYAERKAERETEIQGLKDALQILAGDLALVQRGQSNLRRTPAH